MRAILRRSSNLKFKETREENIIKALLSEARQVLRALYSVETQLFCLLIRARFDVNTKSIANKKERLERNLIIDFHQYQQ